MRPPPHPRRQLAAAGLRPKKSWGQSFLCDTNLLAAIAADLGPIDERTVVELGAGLGGLTHQLLVRGARVVAVERDRELLPVLRQTLAWAERLELLEADAVALDYAALAATRGPLLVTGNLPYQLSSRILVALADQRAHLVRAVLLVQREVAERVAAGPGSRTYGLLSVLVQRAFRPAILRAVPPQVFHPRPKVHSAVLELVVAPTVVSAADEAALVAGARAAFHARRKTIRQSLALALGAPAAVVDQALAAAGLDPRARAETLALADFARLGVALAAAGLLRPGRGG